MDALSAHNAFALSLYNAFALANEGKNFLLSPVSIFATLGMILPGAREETLSQMMEALHLQNSTASASVEDTQAAVGSLLAVAMETKPAVELLMANKAYIDAGYTVRQEYTAALQKYFGAKSESAQLSSNSEAERQRINDWVATVTKGMITDLLTPGSIGTLTRLVLVNALYFKAKWRVPFDPRSTRPAAFETGPDAPALQVPTMHRTANWPLLYIPEVLTGIRFDFEGEGDADCGEGLAMFAVIPAERHSLDGLLARMSPQDWQRLVNAPAESAKVAVSLPKLRLSGRAELTEAPYLPRLGLGGLFGDAADLSGIASEPGDLRVAGFAHQAVLEWDEFGAEAAAASAAVINSRSMPPSIRFDQPFLVLVARELPGRLVAEAGGTPAPRRVPIFIGRVSNPAQ